MALSDFWRHLRGELRDPRGWREPDGLDRANRSDAHRDGGFERDHHTSSFDDRWGNAYALGVPSTGLDYTGRSADPGEYISSDQDDARWWNDRAGWPEQRIGGFRGKGPRGYRRSDERIREDVNECLTDDHHIDASDIEVEVRDAEVTLSGSVSTREQKRRAEELIEQLSGVVDVHNRLRVSSGNSETPQPSV
jgi:BON domain